MVLVVWLAFSLFVLSKMSMKPNELRQKKDIEDRLIEFEEKLF